MKPSRALAPLAAALVAVIPACNLDRAPEGLKKTPDGPGATVRYDLAATPLPDIPLPIDTATWPDPTSRTGLRINASLIASTDIEVGARQRFDEMEGWGTFAPISVSFDLASDGDATRAALDLANVRARHQGDDYEFANDAVYLINLATGVPMVLDIGAKNFEYTLKRLDRYWANDTRASERNLLFETIDESQGGAIREEDFTAAMDTDFDGVMDVPNLDDPFACPDPDPVCDNAREPGDIYNSDECFAKRRARDQCVADRLLTWYERETDTLVMRPLLPLDEMTRYAVVITDRLVDRDGHAVKSPFEYVYHAAQESTARRVAEILQAGNPSYFGDIAGTGLDHVAFVWSFTTQPTVDDLKRLRDGLYGQGVFQRWATQYPPVMEARRAIGLDGYVGEADGWQTTALGEEAGCPDKVDNLFVIRREDIEEELEALVVEGFGANDGPDVQLLLAGFEHVDYLMVGTFEVPFLLEGGPQETDPNSAFRINYLTGEAEESTDTVQFWLIVPEETAEFKQPFDLNIYGHGYTGSFLEQILYAGNMAQHGLATIGINAMGHGVVFGNEAEQLAARAILGGACAAPFYDAFTLSRARDLDRDGIPDSGGDFWSSYLFHTRDGVRQSILDHLQLVRILRSFGTSEGKALCKNADTGWANPAKDKCDFDADGTPELFGDFDANGVIDIGGPDTTFSTWGESLGGILSGIHGAIDPNVTAAIPGSGGGGLTDIGIRSFQGGVIEAVLLRLWGPLLATVPADEREPCGSEPSADCTLCQDGQLSLRWVVPDVNDTGELEIDCLGLSQIADTTLFAFNIDNEERKCVRVGSDGRMRVGVPASIGDRFELHFYDGADGVTDYDSCRPTFDPNALPRTIVASWGPGLFGEGAENTVGSDICGGASCGAFQGVFFEQGAPLTAIAEGYGLHRQSPRLRRFIQLAQAALEPGDPISFAPYYAIKTNEGPDGQPLPPHAVLTLNTIGDMNVPLNSGIAFARATGALPFLRPDQHTLYPEYEAYVTPPDLYAALGDKTPNQDLIERHVIEGITALARHPAGPSCTASTNALPLDATFVTADGEVTACYPSGCESNDDCFSDTSCDVASGQCLPNVTSKVRCDEALLDIEDLAEGAMLYHQQVAPVPHRLARYSRRLVESETINDLWEPRLAGVPFTADLGWEPPLDESRPLTALLDAYVVPQGEHTFVNGNPCQSFDVGTYLTNLTARFFMTKGTDIYYLSHPASHHCLARDVYACGYLEPPAE